MKRTILCVDDEPDIVDSLERIFRKKYSVLKAISGDEALALLKVHDVAVIITDQRMPGMSGVDLLVKSLKLRPEAIRILLTGYADIESVISAINSGHVYRYVTKPWDPVDLSNAVDKAVERWEIGAELAAKNIELKQALTELEVLDAAKTQFMLLVNHELKTPLTSLMSFAELINETDLSAEQKKYMARIQQATQRLHAIVGDTLEFVMAATEKTPLEIKSKKTSALLASPPLFAQWMSQKKLNAKWNIDEVKIQVDEKAFSNIFLRLLHNATKFAKDGSEIEITGRLENGVYRVSIINQAPTLKAAVLERMQKPFTLNEEALNHSTGTGMGLAISQALLKLMGSALILKSERNVFEASFELPLSH